MGDFTANTEAILTECEACEIVRIFGHTKISFGPLKLIWRVYDRALKKYRCFESGLTAVYLLGYIYGIQAERKKRRRR